MSDKQRLLKQIQICGFVLTDTALFLDTHPNNQQALEYHSKYSALYKDLQAEYTKLYGGLTHASQADVARWSWVDNPWPWELEE
ncbi:MAG: spore coat protein CotJB [Oscillospiraceae bacterium]